MVMEVVDACARSIVDSIPEAPMAVHFALGEVLIGMALRRLKEAGHGDEALVILSDLVLRADAMRAELQETADGPQALTAAE